MKKVKHEDHEWEETANYIDICKKCGLKYNHGITEPFYHYNFVIYNKTPSCEEINMNKALE